MDDTIILTELQALARSMPPFMTTPGYNLQRSFVNSDFEWLGTVMARLEFWNSRRAITARVAAQNLHNTLFDGSVAEIKITLYEAIADLTLRVQQRPGGAFAPNAVYDYFRLLRGAISTGNSDVFVADPYLNDEIFDYLSAAGAGASLRLMTTQKTQQQQQLVASLQAARGKFQQQHGRQVEVRTSTAFHDRVIFINKQTCYVSGASIKDAAQRKPTYLAPLSLDLVQDKLSDYEAIWQASTPI